MIINNPSMQHQQMSAAIANNLHSNLYSSGQNQRSLPIKQKPAQLNYNNNYMFKLPKLAANGQNG